MNDVLQSIHKAGFSAYLCGFSAIDSWLGSHQNSGIQVLTNADTADLAKLFEGLRFPGISLADAAIDLNETTIYFRCEDSTGSYRSSFKLLDFFQDCFTGAFHDPHGIYPLLAKYRKGFDCEILPEILHEGLNPNSGYCSALMDAALIIAKYVPQDNETEKCVNKISEMLSSLSGGALTGQEEQRVLLCGLMNSANPAPGLELLKISGFIEKYWNELEILNDADHSKDFHPEGNAWKHTMETFRYRKSAVCDLRLSLGLLLHDAGKPISISAGSKRKRFDGHAELGEIQARKFLERLGFKTSLITDVCFLVRHHMLPAALPRLPLYRTEQIMSSELFPLLLELYRCDESSSFKGLDCYYESSAIYQAFLRNRRNPYRSADGKKLK